MKEKNDFKFFMILLIYIPLFFIIMNIFAFSENIKNFDEDARTYLSDYYDSQPKIENDNILSKQEFINENLETTKIQLKDYYENQNAFGFIYTLLLVILIYCSWSERKFFRPLFVIYTLLFIFVGGSSVYRGNSSLVLFCVKSIILFVAIIYLYHSEEVKRKFKINLVKNKSKNPL